MKLISLHIVNYGKLSNYDFLFENINVICQENGYGKSTIVSFIKSMFYGLETLKNNTSKFLDRKHYYPFNRGVFGGNIVFTYHNQEYRIERIFDEKSEIKDILKVYCNGKETDELGLIPGLIIFGINKDNFEKIISIDANKITLETDSDINKKLNNYVENVSDEFNLDDVLKNIKKYKKEQLDKLKILKEESKKLNLEIHNLEDIKLNLDAKYIELNELENKKNLAKKEYDKIYENKLLSQKYDTLNRYNIEVNQYQSELNNFKNKYSLIPSNEEFNSVKEVENDLKSNNKLLDCLTFNFDEYNFLKSKYENKIDNKEIIEEKINRFNYLKGEISKKNNSEELDKHFLGLDIEQIDLSLIKSKIDNLNHYEKRKNPLIIIVLVISIVLMSVSIIFFINNLMLFFIIFLILWLISLIGDLFLYVNLSLKKVSNIDKDKKQELFNIFSSYRYYGDDFNVLYYQLENDLNNYKQKLKNNNFELQKEYNNLKITLNNFFKEFNFNDDNYSSNMLIINQELIKLKMLENEYQKYLFSRQEYQNQNKNFIEIINKFYNKYNIDKSLSLDEINNDLIKYENINRNYKDSKEKYLNYKNENNLFDYYKKEDIDINLINLNKEKSEKEFLDLLNNINSLEESIASIDDEKNLLKNKNEEKEIIENKINLFDCVNQELIKADESLKEKFVSPIKNKFCEYASLIEKTIGEKVSMDKDYHIYFERNGMLRNSNHLSSGNLAICALCFRLALFDNMFTEEEPFIIMDDPFVMLDQNHFDKTKLVIESLAKNKQIIYFTCHESRKI